MTDRKYNDGDRVTHGPYRGTVVGATWVLKRHPEWQLAVQLDDGTVVYLPERHCRRTRRR